MILTREQIEREWGLPEDQDPPDLRNLIDTALAYWTLRDAVLGLHTAEVGETGDVPWCSHCADLTAGEDWDAIKWPCATAQAVESVGGESRG